MTMPVERAPSTLQEIAQALGDLPRLTRNELDKIRCSIPHLTPNERDRYFSELFLLLADDLVSVQGALNENRNAIEHFDESSRKLTRWLIWLTCGLIGLTFVLAAPIFWHWAQWFAHRW
jgi:hypothetical protein